MGFSVRPIARSFMQAVVVLGVAGLAGCSWFSSSDKRYEPVPLVEFAPEVQVGTAWSVDLGGKADIGFKPTVVNDAVYAAAGNGTVAKIDAADGSVWWRVNVGSPLQAGAGSDGDTTAVVTTKGEVIALDDNGAEKWRARATSEVLVPPVVGDGLVVVRSGDYRVQAFDANTGERVWSFQRPGPSLALRAPSYMIIAGGFVFTGLPGGKLVAINTDNGVIQWEGTVGVPRGASELERVADVVGGPVLTEDLLCAAAYQGRIVCFDIRGGGELVWSRDLSSASGMTADFSTAFAPDVHSVVHAYLLSGGSNIWRQDAMRNRRLSAPASTGRVVALGDYQGYVHFLAREDGRLVGRAATDGSAIVAPLVATPYGVVVQTTGGSVRMLRVGD